MTSFAKLDEVRSVARARSIESFEYFVRAVVGLQGRDRIAQQVQYCVEKDMPLPQLDRKLEEALHAWLCVIGRRAGVISPSPSETFEWLFCESLRDNPQAA